MSPDLTYTTSGLFTRFYPETEAGKIAWLEMAGQEGVAAVLVQHTANVLGQLRRAGYSVTKAKLPDMSMDDILAELGDVLEDMPK